MKAYPIIIAMLVLTGGCSRDEPEHIRIVEQQIVRATFGTNIVLTIREPVHTDLGLRLLAVSNSVAVLEHIPSGARQVGSVETPFFTNIFGGIGLILRSIDRTNEQVNLTRMWSESYVSGKTLREQNAGAYSPKAADGLRGNAQR